MYTFRKIARLFAVSAPFCGINTAALKVKAARLFAARLKMYLFVS